jgi:muramidase (phage lysozyme)
MTLGQLYDFSQPSGQYGQYVKPRLPESTEAFKTGQTSTPMGKYQIVGTTLRNVADQMGLSEDTVFNKETQDKMFLFLAKDAITRGKTSTQQRQNLRKVWEGFKHVDNATLDKLIAEVGNAK